MDNVVYMSLSLSPSNASGQTPMINKIIVPKKHRNKGHGTRALRWALQLLFDAGATEITIFSPSSKGIALVLPPLLRNRKQNHY
jgi:RimJ/RimL family protein N-acetyltransferase